MLIVRRCLAIFLNICRDIVHKSPVHRLCRFVRTLYLFLTTTEMMVRTPVTRSAWAKIDPDQVKTQPLQITPACEAPDYSASKPLFAAILSEHTRDWLTLYPNFSGKSNLNVSYRALHDLTSASVGQEISSTMSGQACIKWHRKTI